MMNVDTTKGGTNGNNANMHPTSVKELSEILHSNRKNFYEAMKAERVEFRSSLKDLSTATEKQEKRKSFHAGMKEKQQSFRKSQGATRKSYFSTIDSEEEKTVAKSVLKKLMEQMENKNNSNDGSGDDDDCDMTDKKPMKKKAMSRSFKTAMSRNKRMMKREEIKSFRHEMKSKKQEFRASLKDLSPEEKAAKRKAFREGLKSKREEFCASFKGMSPDEKSAKRKTFRKGMESKTNEFRAMKEAHQAEMMDARKQFQKLPREEKSKKRQLFKAEMKLKKRVFQTTLWAETREVLAGNDGLSVEEKDALAKIQELPEFFAAQRTAHEAALEAHREAFQAGLDDDAMQSESSDEVKKKRKASQKEIQAKRQAFMADMLAIQQAAFSRLKEAKSMNNACEILESLCLHDDNTEATEDDAGGVAEKAVGTEDAESNFEAKAVEDTAKVGARKIVLKKMITGKNAIRAHARPRKIFRASLRGLSKEQKKSKWQEHQAVTTAAKDEVRNDIAKFKSSLDGLSDEEKAKKWDTRLEEAHTRYVAAASNDGIDFAALHLARVELNQNRLAAKEEGMLKKGRFKKARHNGEEDAADEKMEAESEPSEEMDGKATVEPSEEFKKDLEDFTANLQGLSSQEQKVQWKNRVQELQHEVRKARMMVAMTRQAQRDVLEASNPGGDTGADFEMVEADDKGNTNPMTNEDAEINLEAFEEVRVEEEAAMPTELGNEDDFVVCA